MTGRFDYFVIFAGMRTGSNFLEDNLNALDSVLCHGEVFNPQFVGHKGRSEHLGISLAARNANPIALLERIRAQDGLNGFRFFHDHDPRILDHCLQDRRCAKIILTRNPLESYVSLKIAAQTDQWRLTNTRNRKKAKAVFDGAEFESHLTTLQRFQLQLLHGLQVTGQTAFRIGYDDIGDLDVLNGLAEYLEVADRLKATSSRLKRQNPEPVAEKVANPEDMTAALAQLDLFGLTPAAPELEPRRGPRVPTHIAAPATPLLFLPIPGGPEPELRDWLAALDDSTIEALRTGFNQTALRRWKRANPGHRSFAVLRHPVLRAYACFVGHLFDPQQAELRQVLRHGHGLDLPETADSLADATTRRMAFLDFIDIVRRSLSGQNGLKPPHHWSTQAAILQGICNFAPPDLIAREDTLDADLAHLAAQCGRAQAPCVASQTRTRLGATLEEIYDPTVEAAIRKTYDRDYVTFGFGPWRG